jgi:hypothetical protein
MQSTLSNAPTKCISDVPGLPKQTSTPDPTSVCKNFPRCSSWFLIHAIDRQIHGLSDVPGSMARLRQTKALSPVMDLPTINVFISLVPS